MWNRSQGRDIPPPDRRAHAVTLGALALSLLFAIAGSAQVPSSERAALVAVYQATGGPEWSSSEGWLGAEGTECTWYGVACEGDRVVRLRLPENHLVGTIPSAIGDLTKLRVLNFFRNELEGEIPATVWDLSELDTLVFSLNRLTGALSPEVGRLSKLVGLYLPANQLSGPLPEELGDLTSLRVLFLSANDFSGAIPSSLGRLQGLEQLKLSYNRLSGEIPATLGDLQSLTVLGLGSNQLSGAVPTALTALDGLEQLNLFFNRLTVEDPAVRGFLDGLLGEDLALTQTLPPDVVLVNAIDTDTILVRWRPIVYTADDGGYRVSLRATPSGDFVQLAEVPGKTAFFAFVDGLQVGTTYEVVVQAYTLPHAQSSDELVSLPSPIETGSPAPADAIGSFEIDRRRRASEGESRFYLVRRLGGSKGRVSVDTELVPLSATAGSDFVGVSETIVFEDGELLAKLSSNPVDLIDDDEVEGDETFEIVLRNPTGGATIDAERSRLLVTIAENDLVDTLSDVSSTGTEAKVAESSDGRRLVVWTDRDDDGEGVFGQLFDAIGRPEAERFRANSETAGDQSRPDAAFDPTTGDFVVVWQNATAGGTSIVSRRFSPQGEPSGPERPVDEKGIDQLSPAVAVGPDGRVRIAWQRTVSTGSPAFGPRLANTSTGGAASSIVARSFDPGGEPTGPPVEISTGETDADAPDLAVNEDGDVAVAWEESPDGETTVVVGRLLDDALVPVDSPFPLPAADGSQRAPTIAATDSGEFLVAWQANARDDLSFDVWAQRIDAAGELRNEAFRVNDQVAGSQEQPRIAVDGAGQCFVGWQNAGGGGVSGIVGRLLPGCREVVGEDIQVAAIDDDTPVDPTFSLDSSGRLTSTFAIEDRESSDGGIRARVTNLATAGSECVPSGTELCLQDSRFRVGVEWTDFEGATKAGNARVLTADTGFFWFFDEDNIEIVVKVLDACSLADRYWVFAGGLTNVGVELVVTDTRNGATRAYDNSLGNAFAPILDVDAFDCP